MGAPAEGWLPEERLTAAEVLAGYTTGTAAQVWEEGVRGVLTTGMRADLVWLSADPHTVPAEGWESIAVRGTWLGGVRTHG